MGPWRHSQINREGRSLGPFEWDGDTAAQFRKNMVLPLFNQYLKDGPPANLPAAAIYNTGENHWDRFGTWPLACASGCAAPLTPIYVGPEGSLGFDKPAAGSTSRSEEHTSELQSLMRISYAVFCFQQNKTKAYLQVCTHNK